MGTKVKILKPTYGHSGDTFRELLDIWSEMNLCEVVESPDGFCWVEVDPLPKSHDTLFGSTLLEDVFVNTTTVGGLKHVAKVVLADADAVTSNTEIATVVSSVHPKLSVTVREIVWLPSSLKTNVPGKAAVDVLGVTLLAAFHT